MKPQRGEITLSKKSLVLPSFSQHPWLLQLHGTKERTISFINPFNGSIEQHSVPEMQGKVCLGCFGEWILLLHRKSKGMSLLDLTSFNEIELPTMPEPFESLGSFAISSPPTSPKCVIITVLKDEDFILYTRPNYRNWVKIRPVLHSWYSGIVCVSQGKVYALTRIRKLVVIDLESLPTGAIVGEIIHIPRLFDDENCHLVVSNESIFTILVKFSSGQVNDVKIYTLDTSQLVSEKFQILDGNVLNLISKKTIPWVRSGSINRCSFLLSRDYSISLSANYLGVQCNCIYLLQPDEDGLKLYTICLDDQTTTFKVLLPEETNAWNRLYWVVPSRLRSIKCRTTKTSTVLSSEGEERTNGISISLVDIPEEMVQELLSFLPLPDRIRLTSVCKSLNSLSKYIQDSKVFPWLMCSLECGSLKFFDTFYGVEHSLQMKWLGSDGKLTFHFSKDGWIIASDRKKSLFILNPLTKQGIKLPSVCLSQTMNMPFSFSSVPTNWNCIVLRVRTYSQDCELYTWHRGMLSWNKVSVDLSDNLFQPTSVSPVFLNGEFYILGREGDLLVFNPITKKFRFLNIPVPIHSMGASEIKEEDCYLLELAGKLIYVLKESTMASYAVYKLDQSKMVWVELDDLGDMTTFLSPRNSLLRPSRNRMYANGMLFPRFYGKDRKKPVFYSMQNHAFQPMAGEDTMEIMNCVWFEANLFKIKKKMFCKIFSLEK